MTSLDSDRQSRLGAACCGDGEVLTDCGATHHAAATGRAALRIGVPESLLKSRTNCDNHSRRRRPPRASCRCPTTMGRGSGTCRARQTFRPAGATRGGHPRYQPPAPGKDRLATRATGLANCGRGSDGLGSLASGGTATVAPNTCAHVPTGPVWIHADSGRLQQVVSNLLVNAVTYTDGGGRLWVDLICEERDAVLTVGDTGRVIASDLPRIFEPFTKGDVTSSRARHRPRHPRSNSSRSTAERSTPPAPDQGRRASSSSRCQPGLHLPMLRTEWYKAVIDRGAEASRCAAPKAIAT